MESTHFTHPVAMSPAAVPVSPCGSAELTAADSAQEEGRHSLSPSDELRPAMEQNAFLSPLASLADALPAAPPVIGAYRDIAEDYHVEPRVLGAGRQGSVRLCVHRATGARRAVKSIDKGGPGSAPGPAGGPAREIALLRALDHPGVARLVAAYEDRRRVHLVTELCAGGELFDRIIQKTNDGGDAPCFAEDEAARVVGQVLAAVSHAHGRGVVHRDLKPENILFATSEEDAPVKLIDFGLACRARPDGRPLRAMVGTPYYVAPEVLAGEYDERCDAWSLGIVAYILLCGYPPFNGESDRETYEAVRRGRGHFLTKEWSGVGRAGRHFVRGLLKRDPAKRMTVDQALRHPWITRHVGGTSVTSNASRPKETRVEVVHQGPRGALAVLGDAERNNARRSVQC